MTNLKLLDIPLECSKWQFQFGQFFDYFFNLNNSTMAIRLV